MECNNNRFGLIGIKELFAHRKYSIPDYQRGYSWEMKHIEALYDDILIASTLEDYVHYTGTIVAHINGEKFDIVDGQQRLTTIYILLRAISVIKGSIDSIRDKNFKIANTYTLLDEEQERRLFSLSYQINPNNDSYNLEFNSESKDFSHNLLYGEANHEIENKSHRNLKSCYLFYLYKLSKLVLNSDDNTQFENFKRTLYNQIGFILYITENDKNIGAMFEIINNRGKPLSQLEMIKNYFIYYSTACNASIIRSELLSNWNSIIRNLMICNKTTNEDENSFLRYVWGVFKQTLIKNSYDIYSIVKEIFPVDKKSEIDLIDEKVQEIIRFLRFLHKASVGYKELFTSNLTELECIRNQTPIASIIPLFISIYCKDNISPIEKEKLYSLLEKVNFRVYVLPSKRRSDKGQGFLFNLSYEFYNNDLIRKEGEEEVDDSQLAILKHRLEVFTKDECNIDGFVKNLTLDVNENYDYYQWPGMKYLLANYEVYLKRNREQITENLEKYLKPIGKLTNDRHEKEHIWAQKNREGENKIKNEVQHEKCRLGNFVLLKKGNNIKASAYDLFYFKQIDKKHQRCKVTTDGKNSKYLCKLDIYKSTTQNLQVKQLEDFNNKSIKFVIESSRDFIYRYFEYYQNIIDLNETELVNFALRRWKLDNEKVPEYVIDSKLSNEIRIVGKNKDHITVYFTRVDYDEYTQKR